MLGAVFPICGSVSGDFAFDECQLQAANSGGFARAVCSGDRGLLILVHVNKVFAEPATAHARQLDVRYQMKTAGEIVAFDFAGLALARNADALEAPVSESGDRPTIGPMRDAAKIVRESQGFGGFAWNEQHLQAETRHAWSSGLLANANDLRATFAGVCGDCQKQRTGSGDDDAFSGNIETGF